MKKNAQRKIAFLMALLMVFSLMPVNLFGFGAVSVYAASEKDKTWSFMGVAQADEVKIEGTTGEVDGLLVDATQGKFHKRAGDWALFNEGTIIKVPVEGDCEVVVSGYSNAYNVEGTGPDDGVTTHYQYTGDAGYVKITATGNTFLHSIKTVYAEEATTEAATEEVTTEVTTEGSPEEETTEAATEKTTEATTTEGSAEETTTEKATEVTTTEGSEEKTTEETTTEKATEVTSTEDATTEAPTQEATTEAPTQAPTQAPTESAANPLTTVVKTAAIEAEGGSYSVENGTFTITGAGSKFDKDNSKDSLYYVYFNVKEGTQSITAKVTPTQTASSGAMGIMARNGNEQQDMAAALYYDLVKGKLRIGRHGGASDISDIITDAIYVKLEFSKDKVYYTVAKDADFTDIIKKNGMGATGLDVRNIGFFATEGNVLTVSDIEIIANYKEDGSDEAVKKIVYSSEYGELIPQYAKSLAKYDSNFSFTQTVNGNELNLVSNRNGSKEKGEIRSDKTTDYLLFPQTTENWSVKADVVINSIDSGTDKQGIAVGQFAKTDNRIYADIFQANRDKAMKHNFATDTSANGGNPIVSGIDISGGATYTMQYTKYAADEANPEGYAVMTVYSASGEDLGKGADYPFSLSNCATSLRAGKPVHYGLAISAADVTVTNITVTNEEGYVIYDQNDYYIAVGVAPVVGTVTGTVSEDRKSINVTWDDEKEGVGNAQYIVMVSKDGGEYTLAGSSKVKEFAYKPSADGKYTFKVYGKSGESVSLDEAKISNEVVYITPIADITVTVTGSKDDVTVEFTLAEGATAYDVYRKVTSDGKEELIATINASDIGADAYQTGKYVDVPEEEVPVYYSVTAKNDTNTSNPSEYMQALRTAGHTYAYAVGKEADKLTITAKTNDTVFDGKFSVTGSYAVDGSYVVNVNGKAGKAVEYKAGEAAVIEGTLENGRNDVEVIFTNASGVKSRTVFNFVNAPKYDILVDAAFTGTDGTRTESIPTYSTISAALASIAADNAKQVTVFVKNGTYNERVTVTAPNVSILGEDSEKTRIAYSAAIAEGTATSMWDRNAMYVDSTADGFTLENIWVENSYNYTNGNDQQADAIAIVADNVVVINAKLIGYQDTLLIDSRVKDSTGGYEVTNQYFYKCYITGNVDFIYGSGSAAFEDCDVVGRYTSYKSDGCFTAARTYNYTQYGLIFNNCRFYGEEGIVAGAYRLARPWGADASTVFLNCYMDETITGVGYGDMSGNLYKNARFAEYMSSGAGFTVNNDRPLLSKEQAAVYATEKVLGADFDYKKVMDSLYTGEAAVPSDTYAGDVNTELQKFTYDKETGYLSGQIVVVEWIDGVSTVPTVKPVMTFDSVDGTESIEVFVTPTGTNTYYFDRLIAGLTEGQEYVFHVTSGDSKNVSEYRTVPVYTGTSSIGSEGFLGNIGTTQSIKFKTAEDGTLVLYGDAAESEDAYTGNVNSSLLNVNCVTSETGNFVSGNIVVTEWVNGESVVPKTTPAMSFESVDGSEKLSVYIASIDGTNTYYFDRNLSGDMDTGKEYIFRISLTEENNISARKSMVVTTNYMKKKSGILWTTDTQLICYKTVAADGDNQLRVYALNK